MSRIQVKKVVAVCFVEAAKLTLEHLGAARLQGAQEAGLHGNELTRLYGDVRRLRDLLQRSVSAYPQELVDLDLGPTDAQLLVACCRRAIEAIEIRTATKALSTDEKHWLQRKRQVLGDWAVELAAKPLLELPLERLAKETSEAMRALLVRLQGKAYGDARVRQNAAAAIAAQTLTGGVKPVEEDAAPVPAARLPAEREWSKSTRRAEGIMAPDGSVVMSDGKEAAPAATPAPASSPPRAATPAAPAAAAASPPAGALFDHRQLRDPRLRALVIVDLHSYERSLAAGDFRLATVILSSIIEAALLDHAIPRRAEFGLTGAPDSWKPHELLLAVLGDRGSPKDHSLAFNLFASRNLLRPAVQMMTPAVTTADSFERARDLVQRTLHVMGFGMAEPAAGANDLLAGMRDK